MTDKSITTQLTWTATTARAENVRRLAVAMKNSGIESVSASYAESGSAPEPIITANER